MWAALRFAPSQRAVAAHAPLRRTRNPRLLRSELTWPAIQRVRHATSQAGEDKTGHIVAGPNEGILFVDNIYPLKLLWLLRWLYSGERYLEQLAQKGEHAGINPSSVIASAVPKDGGIHIESVVPRLKDGGVFVKFKHDPGMSPAKIEDSIRSYLKTSRPRPWWNPFDHVRAHLVRGRPWVEDLYRPPSRRVRVEFVPEEAGDAASELSQEQLYSIFRPFGKLLDIIPQPSDSKILPKYALVDFRKLRRAIMATNCLHGMSVKEELGDKSLARLKMSYERQTRTSWIKDWLFGHPRIVIPLVAALVATITITVFDPIRIFFVKTHIQRTFHIEDNRFFKWVSSRAERVLDFTTRGSRENEAASVALLEDRKADIEKIQGWLMESADNFIVVQGPNGSGKKELVMHHTINNRKTKLIIDCKPIQEARSDTATINATAQQVGYRPVFSWMNSISGLLDLAAQSTTGVKAGFTETLDSQLDKILNNTAAALKQLALADKSRDPKDAKMDEDSYLEAHPERRPVVVIDNFLHKSQDSSVIYDKLANWSAQISTSNIAHVIFLTTNASYAKSLSRALPDRAFRHLSLSDFKPDVAKRFVLSHLATPLETVPSKGAPAEKKPGGETSDEAPVERQPEFDAEELDAAIRALGGRLTDLEYLARRIKHGEAPSRAVSQILIEAASEIMKMHLLPSSSDENRRYSPAQAWQLVSSLAQSDQLRYNEVVTSAGFAAGGDAALAAMEQAELISVVSSGGRPFAIVPARPVYAAAFKSLAEDRVLASRLDLGVLNSGIKGENESINKVEEELRLLSELAARGKGVPRELQSRVSWLLAKVKASQSKILEMEERIKGLKSVLGKEF